jgi:hypothetical protein
LERRFCSHQFVFPSQLPRKIRAAARFFRTKNAYAISAEVKIAVPFSPESPNAPAIYMAARVMNITELPESKMFRWGVAFLPVAGTRTHA